MKTKSIWGNPPKRLYRLMNHATELYGKDFTACIVGCSDGKFLMPFARRGIKVMGYDVDDTALYGGYKDFPIDNEKIKHKYTKNFVSKDFPLENRYVCGITERIEKENLKEFVKIEKRDFYKNLPKAQFDVVFTSCSLHYSLNKDHDLKEKTKMLQDIVKPNGLLYMDYMMAIDESNYDTYPSFKFYRKGEILDYFDESWEIISFIENNSPSFEAAHVDCVKDHFHRFGYMFAKKKGN